MGFEPDLDIDHDIELRMTHDTDTDVLEPEPARQGGLVRKDLVGCPFCFQANSSLILWQSNTSFVNQKNLRTPLRREHPL